MIWDFVILSLGKMVLLRFVNSTFVSFLLIST